MTRWFTFDALFAFCELHTSRIHRLTGALEEFFLCGAKTWPRYFDRQGFPIPGDGDLDPTLVWARIHSQRDYTIVAQDDLPDGSYLSTVWLGLDHGFGGPPLIFETMRFSRDEEELTIPMPGMIRQKYHPKYHPSADFPDPETGEPIDQLRYTTEEEALAAHHEIVRRIRVREGH